MKERRGKTAPQGAPEASGTSRASGISRVIERTREGNARALGVLLSLVEDAAPELRPIMKALADHTGQARIVGLTGAPGVGKSSLTNALVGVYRQRGLRVAVLAVDPSSPFSGGALLGDRVRMQAHATDPGVFIRSMATRGHLGGLSRATPQALRVLEAAGFDLVLVETVGVGQAEVEVASLADTTLVISAPGMGDAIQAIKAGILETADVLVVNKADKPGAQETVRDLRGMVAMAPRREGWWRPPIVTTTATAADGVAELAERVDQHWAWLDSSGEGAARRTARAREEVSAIALAELRRLVGGLPGDSRLDELASQVACGDIDPFSAADELVALAVRQA